MFHKQIFHAAAENFGDAVEGIDTCLVDVLVSLLIHLGQAKSDAGMFCNKCMLF